MKTSEVYVSYSTYRLNIHNWESDKSINRKYKHKEIHSETINKIYQQYMTYMWWMGFNKCLFVKMYSDWGSLDEIIQRYIDNVLICEANNLIYECYVESNEQGYTKEYFLKLLQEWKEISEIESGYVIRTPYKEFFSRKDLEYIKNT